MPTPQVTDRVWAVDHNDTIGWFLTKGRVVEERNSLFLPDKKYFIVEAIGIDSLTLVALYELPQSRVFLNEVKARLYLIDRMVEEAKELWVSIDNEWEKLAGIL